MAAQAAPRPSPRAALRIRLLVAPPLLAVALGVLWLHDRTGNPLPTDLLLFLLGAAGGAEMVRLLERRGPPLPIVWIALATGLLSGVGLLAPGDAALRFELRTVLLASAFLLLSLRALRDTRAEAVQRLSLSLVPLVWVGLLLSFSREVGAGPEGARLLAFFALVAKASDVGGWLVGKPLGRHKLMPSVSPGKSWEGLAGGLAASVLAAVVLPRLLVMAPGGWSVLRRALFGLVIGGAAVVAGLLHSAWKRRVGAKDSSTLIPEMGGVLDMLDSLLLAGPAAWAWLVLGL